MLMNCNIWSIGGEMEGPTPPIPQDPLPPYTENVDLPLPRQRPGCDKSTFSGVWGGWGILGYSSEANATDAALL